MNYFLNDILEDDHIRTLMARDEEHLSPRGRALAEEIARTGRLPAVEPGMLQLFVLAHLADAAREKNRARGIPDKITDRTLKDVNVWIQNYRTKTGLDGTAEIRWLSLHFSGDLFRLGRLQFRLEKALDGVPGGIAIETHIPQGEPLCVGDCLASLDLARAFFSAHFHQTPLCFQCDSWLLNPNLTHVLPPEANIVRFMRQWKQVPFVSDHSAQAIERIFGFGKTREDLKNAPENTVLQRNAKAYLLAGGSLEITAGYRMC